MTAATRGSFDAELAEFRQVVAQVLSGGPLVVAQDLGNLLLEISARLGRVQRGADARAPLGAELKEVDDAFTRAVALTRKMREHLAGRHRRSELTSASQVACELAAVVGPAMPEHAALLVTYPTEPCIVAASAGELQRVIVGLVAAAVEGLGPRAQVHVSVGCEYSTEGGRRGTVRLDVRCSEDPRPRASEQWTAATYLARDLAQSMGGTMNVAVEESGAVVVSILCALVC